MATSRRGLDRLTRNGVLFLTLIGMLSVTFVSSGVAYAAHDEPSADHTYTYLELGKKNTFRVYAQPGEWIHYTVFAGYRSGKVTNINTCATINIQDSLGFGSPVDVSGGKRSGTLYDGTTTFSDTNMTPVESSTCSADNKPFTEVTLSYQVPFTKSLYSMSQAYSLKFLPHITDGQTIDGSDQRGYKWRITVNDSENDFTSDIRTGRVWVVGNDAGLNIWQDDNVTNIGAGGANPTTVSAPARDKALDYNATNHTFKFVRDDGYRYTATYYDYQGIWSVIHGGVYGVRLNNGSFVPAYKSYANKKNVSLGLFTYTVSGNVSYIFLDCAPENKPIEECPAGLDQYINGALRKDADGNNISIIRDKPITSETSTITDGRNTYSNGNPIADKNEKGQKNANGDDYNLRYLGYNATSNLAGGTLTIPYYAMQTGTIRMIATWYPAVGESTLLCQRDWLIDDGTTIAGEKPWKLQKDTKCTTDSYLYSNNAPTIPPGDKLVITVQALRLGEMHFVEVDTEERGGIQVISNNKDKSSSLAWYDPFSRAYGDVCPNAGSAIPPRIADGTANTYSTDWDSMSSAFNTYDSINSLPRIQANTTTLGDPDRRMVDSIGGAHGWVSGDNCDPSGDGAKDGYSNYNGTATTYSTWGNDRIIDDWTYDDNIPQVLSLTIGGPSYTLKPNASISPSPVVPGDVVSVTRTVTNDEASEAAGIRWDFHEAVFDPGTGVAEGLRSGATWVDPCSSSGYFAAASSCSGIASVPGVTFNSGSTDLGTYGSLLDTSKIAVGSRICYSLAVTPYSSSSGSDFRQYVTCAVVAAAPYMSIIGGDIWAGGSTSGTYMGSADILGSPSYRIGSFGEYGVFATGKVDYFGSAARLGVGSTAAKTTATGGARLTFGSYDSTIGLGKFTTSHKISDLVASLCPGGLHPGSPPPLGGIYTTANDGVICYDTVHITSDIKYATATTFAGLPSLTVVANDIEIDGDVGEIAGNFYAVNKFVTCKEGDKSNVLGFLQKMAATGSCARKLTINGTVSVASQAVDALVLNRSAGGTTVGQPAEVIRMRPEVFLTPFSTSLQLETVNETELPARY